MLRIIYFVNINNYVSIFQTKQTRRQENVKELGELKAETVNNADGTDGTKEKTGNMKSDNKQNP